MKIEHTIEQFFYIKKKKRVISGIVEPDHNKHVAEPVLYSENLSTVGRVQL